jgi:hypothetical protein
MTKEEFLDTVKKGIQYQRLSGDIMTYIEYDNVMICPFCGKNMNSVLKNAKLVQLTCNCDEAKKYNAKLNELIVIVENAQDQVKEIFEYIDKKALDMYKAFYIKDIHPMLQNQLSSEKEMILNSSFDY